MDVTMIDVTDVTDTAIGDVVTIYGSDGRHVRPANVIARSIGTVTSDLLCAVSQRVPRLFHAPSLDQVQDQPCLLRRDPQVTHFSSKFHIRLSQFFLLS